MVVAPDSFKGSLSAKGVGEAMKRGIHTVFPSAKVEVLPMADGGEGTVDALLYANNGKIEEVEVHGPMMERVMAKYGVFEKDGVQYAVIECAESTGLTLVPYEMRNPMIANSFGFGEVICDALRKGYRHLIVTLGGSATNDGGVGMLQALGWKFYNSAGDLISPFEGNGLIHIVDFSVEDVLPALLECTISIASDVMNPFYGENGAAFIFGPQKGANAEQVIELDDHLRRFSDLVKAKLGVDLQGIRGAGAAGGLGGAFAGCLGAKMKSGAELVLNFTGADEKIRGADLVFTGEGSLDSQSMFGKVPVGVAKLAKEHGVSVIGVAGRMDEDTKPLNEYLDAVFSIQTQCRSLEDAMRSDVTKKQIEVTVEQVCRVLGINN
ncbi:glycerate kinase family protein [Sutcliffiella sp. NC1]|uniref:glycerate kinase family protein n=1 Tax=Sutcliffiella sp. NC1 TaxID=3004096 RepID=UPI0022DDD03D|nr:glycerate kinase [Sutcliffiella sp. NC1]WBL17693.1 glycerate kinase [Sutcliffiella sp. NC1]